MRQHYRLFAETKQQYAAVMAQAKRLLAGHLSSLRQNYGCAMCKVPQAASESELPSAWFAPLHANCGYQAWQAAALDWMENTLGKEILTRLQQIGAYRDTFDCHMCGMCCRLASVDAPYETLEARSAAGDNFAKQFTSIFLPYASREAAREKYPEVVAAVLAEAEEQPDTESVYFYHCPYIGEDNRCTVYGTDKRPDICASYPETPLTFVYEKCAWQPWKSETYPDALMAHATLALCQELSIRLKKHLP